MNSIYRPLYGNPANLDADSGDVEIASTDDTDIGMSDMEIDDNSDVDVDLDFEEVYQTSDVDNALQAVYQRMNLLDHDLGNTLLSAVTVRGGELERDIELDEITQSLNGGFGRHHLGLLAETCMSMASSSTCTAKSIAWASSLITFWGSPETASVRSST